MQKGEWWREGSIREGGVCVWWMGVEAEAGGLGEGLDALLGRRGGEEGGGRGVGRRGWEVEGDGGVSSEHTLLFQCILSI